MNAMPSAGTDTAQPAVHCFGEACCNTTQRNGQCEICRQPCAMHVAVHMHVTSSELRLSANILQAFSCQKPEYHLCFGSPAIVVHN